MKTKTLPKTPEVIDPSPVVPLMLHAEALEDKYLTLTEQLARIGRMSQAARENEPDVDELLDALHDIWVVVSNTLQEVQS